MAPAGSRVSKPIPRERKSRLICGEKIYAMRPRSFDSIPSGAAEWRRREFAGLIPDKVYNGVNASILKPDTLTTQGCAVYPQFQSEDALDRGRVAGFNEYKMGMVSFYHPRISRSDYYKLKEIRKPELPGRISSLASCMSKTSPFMREVYVDMRKAVRPPTEEGGEFCVVRRIPDAMDEQDFGPDDDCDYDILQKLSRQIPYTARRPEKMKLTLGAALTMQDVFDELRIPLRVVEGIKRMAATRPLLAAKSMQHTLNHLQTQIDYTVTPGRWGDSPRHAEALISQMSEPYRQKKRLVRTSVIGKKLMMYGTDALDHGWGVMGPLKYARAVRDVFNVVAEEGLHVPNAVFTIELVLLGIDITDGRTCAPQPIDFCAADPKFGPLPEVGVLPDVARALSSSKLVQLKGMTDRILPVHTIDGDSPVATAIRITGKAALVNAHVIEAGEPLQIDRTAFTCNKQVSRDAWVVNCVGRAQPWKMRNPIAGETVAIVYRTGDIVSTSMALRIVAVNGGSMVLSQDESVRKGCSGGAVVSLSDLALLGIYSAATASNLLAYTFSVDDMAELLDLSSLSSTPEPVSPVKHARSVYEKFTSDGLSGYFDSVVQSLTPVSCGGKQIGSAVNVGTKYLTTCDASLPLRFGPDKLSGIVKTELPGRVYSIEASFPDADVPRFVRKPKVGERVVIVGRTSEEPFISLSTTVDHVGLDYKDFFLRPLPETDLSICGGAVMGMDGAVLGIASNSAYIPNLGICHPCYPLEVEIDQPLPTPREFLARTFPFLHIELWPESVIEEIFVHSSVGKYADAKNFNSGQKPLAAIGETSVKWLYHRMLRKLGEPHTRWVALIQERLSPARSAELAWSLRLTSQLELGPGVDAPKGSRIYTDLFNACCGAVSLCEDFPVFVKFCVYIELLPDVPLDVQSSDFPV